MKIFAIQSYSNRPNRTYQSRPNQNPQVYFSANPEVVLTNPALLKLKDALSAPEASKLITKLKEAVWSNYSKPPGTYSVNDMMPQYDLAMSFINMVKPESVLMELRTAGKVDSISPETKELCDTIAGNTHSCEKGIYHLCTDTNSAVLETLNLMRSNRVWMGEYANNTQPSLSRRAFEQVVAGAKQLQLLLGIENGKLERYDDLIVMPKENWPQYN